MHVQWIISTIFLLNYRISVVFFFIWRVGWKAITGQYSILHQKPLALCPRLANIAYNLFNQIATIHLKCCSGYMQFVEMFLTQTGILLAIFIDIYFIKILIHVLLLFKFLIFIWFLIQLVYKSGHIQPICCMYTKMYFMMHLNIMSNY